MRRGVRRDPLWEHAVDEFLAEKRRAGASPATIDTYTPWLRGKRTMDWLAAHGITRLSEFTTARLREFELDLATMMGTNGKPLGAHYRHQGHRTFHAFLNFAKAEGWAVDDGTLSIRGPKLPQRSPDTLSEADEKRLYAACRYPRDRYLLEFMVRTGMRLGGVCAVTLDDILQGPEGAVVRVVEKGDKQRVIPLDTVSYRGTRRLRAYIDTVRPKDTKRRELFLTIKRERFGDYAPLHPHAIQTLFRRLGEETGVRLHPHMLRHTMASRAIAAGVDPLTLQRVLGHTSLTMVNRYVHHDTASLTRIWGRRTD